MDGAVREGHTFTLEGDATVYTVQADVTADANTLTDVPILPVLSQAFSDGDTVALVAYTDYTFYFCSRGNREADIEGTSIASTDRQIMLAGLNAPITPDDDDKVIIDGEPTNIARVRAFRPDNVTQVGWTLDVGSR
jgi:hypothetical protein